VNAAGLPTRAAKAHESLDTVLRTIHAEIVAEACTHIAVPRGAVRPDGRVDDPEIRRRIAEVLDALRRHVA
jgi:hypothetical protein